MANKVEKSGLKLSLSINNTFNVSKKCLKIIDKMTDTVAEYRLRTEAIFITDPSVMLHSSRK